jgi:hypothetical protein
MDSPLKSRMVSRRKIQTVWEVREAETHRINRIKSPKDICPVKAWADIFVYV